MYLLVIRSAFNIFGNKRMCLIIFCNINGYCRLNEKYDVWFLISTIRVPSFKYTLDLISRDTLFFTWSNSPSRCFLRGDGESDLLHLLIINMNKKPPLDTIVYITSGIILQITCVKSTVILIQALKQFVQICPAPNQALL